MSRKINKMCCRFERCKLKRTHCLPFSLKIYFSILLCSIQNSKRPVWWNHHRFKIDQIQENLHVLKSEETVFDVAIEAGGCKAVKTLLPNIIFDLSEKKIYILCVPKRTRNQKFSTSFQEIYLSFFVPIIFKT